MSKEITEIKCNGIVRTETQKRYITYTMTSKNKKEFLIPIILPCNTRPEKSLDIIDDSSDFVNGFKVVQTANKEYAYVREEDNILLPYRYDIATDFNEYGYAMVGKDASVSWIDRNFKYLYNNGKMIKENLDDEFSLFEGFNKITNFSKGKNPLSTVYRDECFDDLVVSYFGIEGKFKTFYYYDNERICEYKHKKYFPINSTPFNDKDYATFDKSQYILLASGYYVSVENLIRLCGEKGFLDTISSKIAKQEQAYTKFLRDVEEKTMDLVGNLSKINNLIAEYNIEGIELIKDELISKYGKDIYERALTNKFLACLIYNQKLSAKIVDLELFQSILARKGIPSYIDNAEKVFHYNTSKHVKVKR